MSRLLDVHGGLTYAQAGVSIEAGDEAVAAIRAHVETTRRPEVLGAIGGFGGLFSLREHVMRDPVLVSSADGVGTKLEVARQVGRFDTIGIDLVAMLVDDLACVGAEALFVLDYVAVGSLHPARLAEIVAGVAAGCVTAGAALLGGETAEHGGVMEPDAIDVAGFCVGLVERDELLGPERVRDGDLLVGLASPGLRSNGYTLARRVLRTESGDLDRPAWPGAATTLAEELLRPSLIYSPVVQAVRRTVGGRLHAAAHITGGGIPGNVVRALPEGLAADISLESFETPEIFFEIQRRGSVAADEMLRVFNCGLGMVLAVAADAADDVVELSLSLGYAASVVGRVTEGPREVRCQ